MKFQIAALTLLAASVSAQGIVKRSVVIPRELLVRQTSGCPTGYDECGQVCIESDYTCCPDRLGGCGPTEECQLGDNGEYGCCDRGEICTGDGGVETTYNDDFSTTEDDFTTTTSSRRATPTEDDSETTTTSRTRSTSSSTASPTGNVDPGSASGSGNGGNAAGNTYGSLSSALVMGSSAAVAALTLAAALIL